MKEINACLKECIVMQERYAIGNGIPEYEDGACKGYERNDAKTLIPVCENCKFHKNSS